MRRFERNNRRPTGRDFGRKTEMYSAVCDQCGKDCKVPFKPSGDKPIYCSRCFEQQGNGNSNRFEKRDSSRNFKESRSKEMYSAVCDQCGIDCQVPFNPSPDKPIYCSKCFEKRNGSSQSSNQSNCNCENNSEQINEILSKLDQILLTLESQKKIVKEKKTTSRKKTKKE